jgi:hypothetical protein
MELSELKDKIIGAFNGKPEELQRILQLVDEDQLTDDKQSLFPFNEIEHILVKFIENGGLTFRQYEEIREEYHKKNPNLWYFQISAPTTFGSKVVDYLQSLCSKLKGAETTEYDLSLDEIKIEVNTIYMKIRAGVTSMV